MLPGSTGRGSIVSLLRARLRLSGDRRMSLNPFDKALFFGDREEIVGWDGGHPSTYNWYWLVDGLQSKGCPIECRLELLHRLHPECSLNQTKARAVHQDTRESPHTGKGENASV